MPKPLKLPHLILASASPRRSDLLRQLEVEFQIIPPRVEEILPQHLTPCESAQINAYRKARVVAKKHPDDLVLGADTIVCLGDEVFGKPANRLSAVRMLEALQGRTHEVITGVCLVQLRQHHQTVFAVTTSVTLRALLTADIEHYLGQIDPLDKAGAYAIQEQGELIVQSVSGSFTNVVGLPLERLREELTAWKVTR